VLPKDPFLHGQTCRLSRDRNAGQGDVELTVLVDRAAEGVASRAVVGDGEQVGDDARATEDVAEDAITAAGVAAGNSVALRAGEAAAGRHAAGNGRDGDGAGKDSEDGGELHFC